MIFLESYDIMIDQIHFLNQCKYFNSLKNK
jgi:hypothetical protein